MKLLFLLSLAVLASGCTTVSTYDHNGDLIGRCKITGFLRKGGQCLGQANGQNAPLHIEYR